jgi:hypothetical protein
MSLMNFSFLQRLFSQIPERTKTILIAVVAFGVGTLFAGSGGSGRYVPLAYSPQGTSGVIIIDTKTGTAWRAEPSGSYTKVASFSYF